MDKKRNLGLKYTAVLSFKTLSKVQARCFYELCKIKAERGERDEALQLLAKAKQITDALLKKKEQSDDTESIKILNTDIHIMIGDLAGQNGDYDNATKFYSKATTFLPNSNLASQCRLKLANAFRLKGEHAHAQGNWLLFQMPPEFC